MMIEKNTIKNKNKSDNIDCLEVTKYFIIKAYEEVRDLKMTNMKIQKLLYYAQSLYLALYDKPLFKNQLEAWLLGPVCPSAYQYYSEFESKHLSIPETKEIENLSPEIKKVLEEVWWYFGKYHAYQLSEMSHVEFPWRKARAGLPSSAPSNNIIELEELKILGEEKLFEIEKEHPLYDKKMKKVLQSAKTEMEKSDKLINANEIEDWLIDIAA